MTVSSIVIALMVLFLAALTKSTLGFGDALVAMPLLTLTLDVQTAASVVGLLGACVSLLMLIKGWRQVDLRTTWRLTLAALISIPFGVWGLTQLPEVWMKTALGVLLILVGLYNLTHPKIRPLQEDYWAYGFGFVAGLLGGAYTISGPPVIIYGTTKGWSPEQFRATLQSFFLPVSLMIVLSQAREGFWTADVLRLFVLSIPVMVIGFLGGNALNQRLNVENFERIVYGALIVLGGMLLVP
jgi:uncharacterized protein